MHLISYWKIPNKIYFVSILSISEILFIYFFFIRDVCKGDRGSHIRKYDGPNNHIYTWLLAPSYIYVYMLYKPSIYIYICYINPPIYIFDKNSSSMSSLSVNKFSSGYFCFGMSDSYFVSWQNPQLPSNQKIGHNIFINCRISMIH